MVPDVAAGRRGGGDGGAGGGRAKLGGGWGGGSGGFGWCLFFNLASTFFEIVEQKTPGSVLLRGAVHTALGLGPLKSPVMSDASESRRIIQSRYNYKRVHPGGSRSVSDTHTYSIHVCRAFASAPFMIAAKFVIVLIIKKHLSRSFCFRPGA